jgi:selenophosphate synthetase-related protein
MSFIIIGEDGDILRQEDIVSVTFGNRKKYPNEADVRFWFKAGFYLDYTNVSEEEKEQIRKIFEEQKGTVKIGGKRKKA